jgi:hypothetical protein
LIARASACLKSGVVFDGSRNENSHRLVARNVAAIIEIASPVANRSDSWIHHVSRRNRSLKDGNPMANKIVSWIRSAGFSACVSGMRLFAADPDAVRHVHADRTRATISPLTTGACIEDVKHEI